MKHVVTIAFLMLFSCSAMGQDINQFAGVWSRTTIDADAFLGNIKIMVVDGKLDFQIKHKKDGILHASGIIPDGNKFRCRMLESENRDATWKLGHWKNDPEIEILAFYHDGSRGTNFEPSRIYSRSGIAKCQKCYYSFECQLDNGNLKVSSGFEVDYTDGNTVLFEDHNGPSFVDTYTNW